MVTLHLLFLVCNISSGLLRHEVTDNFDMVEVNHVCNEWGFPQFDQLIFWNWHREDCRDKNDPLYNQAFDRLVDNIRRQRAGNLAGIFIQEFHNKGRFIGGPMMPVKQGDEWVCVFWERGIPHRVFTRIYRETWTQYDPERRDREVHPVSVRSNFSTVAELPVNP